MTPLAKVVLVGGPDIDARLALMQRLKETFDISALGSQAALRDTFAAAGFDYHVYTLSRQVNPFSDLLAIGQLARVFRRLKPHIVHTFDTKPGVWGALAARLAGVPVIVGTVTGLGSLYVRDDLKTRLLRALYQTLQKAACRFSDRTIFQNHDDARQFIGAGIVARQKAAVILGSGVQTERFAPGRVAAAERAGLRAELGLSGGEVVITMISRVIRSKGVLEFMAAAEALAGRHPEARFLLVGPDDRDSLDRLSAAELERLKRVVNCAGPRQDIPAVLAVSDIFILPSAYREGIPRVILEAAAMGLPIVTTDSPGCNEVVADGLNGFLIPVGDAPALAAALTRLLEQPPLRQRFGQMSRQRAVEQFDLSVVADQTCCLYRQLLAAAAR